MLTILFPIRIALSILPELSITLPTVIALLLPSSIRERILILLTIVKAVSADEKNADNNNKMIIIIICAILSVSKKNHSFINIDSNDKILLKAQ